MDEQHRQEWRTVPGYEGIYEVSNLGAVRSLARSASSRAGQARRERVLRPSASVTGYEGVALWINGKRTRYLVHRLVLTAFVGPCPDGHQGCHNDGNPKNNTLANLRWDSMESNQADRIGHGTAFNRANHPRAKIRPDALATAVRLREQGQTYESIAAALGVSRRAVSIAINQESRNGPPKSP